MAGYPGDHTAMVALLNGLLVGAGQMMDTVGEWAERLLVDNPAPLVVQFVDQLDDEWLDAVPPDSLCETVAAQVRRRMSSWHPGWPHLWAHVLRVTGITLALAEDEAVDPALGYLVGICHDVTKLDEFRTGEPHEETGADFVGDVLRERLPAASIQAIQAAILKEGDDTLADILHDADKLDKIGAAGVVRRVSVATRPGWLITALWRVGDDLARFSSMHFDRSRDLADSKRDFLAWFLPLAEDAAHSV
ncbi:MAG: HD domain-containing protein [Anaerolineae bacterium]|nr:HD domain-containing protein [Anaerolineae bacterium]